MDIKPNIRKFIASSDLFGGYETTIDLNYCNSLDDIVNVFYEDLYNCLNFNNFLSLVNKVKHGGFHIHEFTFEDIVMSKEDRVFYICDHC